MKPVFHAFYSYETNLKDSFFWYKHSVNSSRKAHKHLFSLRNRELQLLGFLLLWQNSSKDTNYFIYEGDKSWHHTVLCNQAIQVNTGKPPEV